MAQPGAPGQEMPGVLPAGAAPGAGGGGAPAGAGPAALPPLPPRDYTTRFADPGSDSYAGDYTELHARFSVDPGPNGQPTPPATLMGRATALAARPASSAYAFLVDRGGGPRVEVLINPAVHSDLPGHAPSGYDAEILAQLGDVRRTRTGFVSVAAAVVTSGIFRLTNNGQPSRVPTVAAVDAAIEAAVDANQGLGPYAAQDPDTEEIRSRYLVPLGASLAALCLGDPLTPVQFWQIVGGHIRADPAREAACQAVLDWARLALIAPAAALRPCQSAPPRMADLQGDALEGRLELAQRDLPGLRPGMDEPMRMMASSMGTLVSLSQHAAHEAALRRAEDRAPKTPSTLFKGALAALLRLCEVTAEADLPPIYGRIANADKTDRLSVVTVSRMSAFRACVASMVLVAAGAEETASSSSTCELYMAESTVLPALALFSGVEITSEQRIGQPEAVLPFQSPNKNEYSPWHDFAWGPDVLPVELRQDFQDNMLVSGVGSLGTCFNNANANVQFEKNKVQRYSGGIATTDPAADAVSYYQDFYFETTKDIAAGQELFLDCPYESDELLAGRLRSIQELEQTGVCVDNLVVGRSSIEKIGRGAFSKRSVAAGEIVTATPLVHMDRSQVEIYEQEHKEKHVIPTPRAHGIAYTSKVVGTQLLLNYCYGAKDSNVLLFPYAPGVNFINHSEDTPNVAIHWSSAFDSKELREETPLMELYEMVAGSLVMEFVALTDISPGDEIFLDYGAEWAAAWKQHVEEERSAEEEPFRHEIGVPRGFFPANWNKNDAKPHGDFIANPLEPNMMAPIRWNGGPEHAQVVTPWAFRIGLKPRIRQVLLEYCNKMGITDILKHVTVEGNGLLAGTEDHMNVEGDDWYIQRPGEDWRSNLHWFSPGAGPAHEHYLQALSVAGFDEVLEGVGEYLGMDGLVAFHVTFIGCSRSTKGFVHHDVIQTGTAVYNVIIPLILANETGPELDLQSWHPDLPEETQEYKIGRYRYEYDVATMMGDNAYHATSAVDYRMTKGFRMAATVYIADVNDSNIRSVMEHYTQVYPPRNDIDLLRSWYGRHWKRSDPSRKLPKPEPDHILMRSRFASDDGSDDIPTEEL